MATRKVRSRYFDVTPSRFRQSSWSVFSIVVAWSTGFGAIWILPIAALAIGPDDQKIPDAPMPLSLRATGSLAGPAGTGIGTGTVVATKIVGTTGYAAVLTARHVADRQPAALKLGALISGAAPWLEFATLNSFRSFRYTDPQNNPKNLPADVALILGTVKSLTQGSQALARFNELRNNLPTVTNPAQGAGNPLLKATRDMPVGFTQLGYGRLAQYRDNLLFIDDSTTVKERYQATGVSGERLFQNNAASEYSAPAVVKDPVTNEEVYFQPQVRFHVVGPPNNMGRGLGMGGDSGGPLFTMSPAAAVSVQVTRGGNNIQIPIDYTDSLSAVFVASQPVVVTQTIDGIPVKTPYDPETVLINASQFAVPIDQPLYDWIKPVLVNPCLIPEPASMVLLVVGCLMLVLLRRHNDNSVS